MIYKSLRNLPEYFYIIYIIFYDTKCCIKKWNLILELVTFIIIIIES